MKGVARVGRKSSVTKIKSHDTWQDWRLFIYVGACRFFAQRFTSVGAVERHLDFR